MGQSAPHASLLAPTPSTVTQEFEIPLALGGERAWDFDWTTFDLPPALTNDRKSGGWRDLGFRSQGQGIASIVAHARAER